MATLSRMSLPPLQLPELRRPPYQERLLPTATSLKTSSNPTSAVLSPPPLCSPVAVETASKCSAIDESSIRSPEMGTEPSQTRTKQSLPSLQEALGVEPPILPYRSAADGQVAAPSSRSQPTSANSILEMKTPHAILHQTQPGNDSPSRYVRKGSQSSETPVYRGPDSGQIEHAYHRPRFDSARIRHHPADAYTPATSTALRPFAAGPSNYAFEVASDRAHENRDAEICSPPASPPFSHRRSHLAPPFSSSAQSDHRSTERQYDESVRRHLDIFDLEYALGEVLDHSNAIFNFGQVYRARLHQSKSQRHGFAPGALPAITEIDELIERSERTWFALTKAREVLLAQQESEMQKNRSEQRKRSAGAAALDVPRQQTDSITVGEDGKGSDAKKRRGRTAAPGRCHSCNKADTPEWRRGPDGARTLCNACGLHYAKLTRKAGMAKQNIGSSNLRSPKSARD